MTAHWHSSQEETLKLPGVFQTCAVSESKSIRVAQPPSKTPVRLKMEPTRTGRKLPAGCRISDSDVRPAPSAGVCAVSAECATARFSLPPPQLRIGPGRCQWKARVGCVAQAGAHGPGPS